MNECEKNSGFVGRMKELWERLGPGNNRQPRTESSGILSEGVLTEKKFSDLVGQKFTAVFAHNDPVAVENGLPMGKSCRGEVVKVDLNTQTASVIIHTPKGPKQIDSLNPNELTFLQ